MPVSARLFIFIFTSSNLSADPQLAKEEREKKKKRRGRTTHKVNLSRISFVFHKLGRFLVADVPEKNGGGGERLHRYCFPLSGLHTANKLMLPRQADVQGEEEEKEEPFRLLFF